MLTQNLERIGKLLAAALLALFVTLIATFFALAGVISVAAAQVVLLFAFLVGVVFIWIEVFPNKRKKHWRSVSIVLLVFALGGLDWWTLKQKRAHLYVSNTQFSLGNTVTPRLPENFADVNLKNEGELDVHVVEYSRIAPGDVFLSDPPKQREVENRLFEGMLAKLSTTRSEELARVDIEIPAHGEQRLSHEIAIPYTVITTMAQGIYFMGRITYTDENGSHRTDFCTFIRNKSEPVFYCKGHNEAP